MNVFILREGGDGEGRFDGVEVKEGRRGGLVVFSRFAVENDRVVVEGDAEFALPAEKE